MHALWYRTRELIIVNTKKTPLVWSVSTNVRRQTTDELVLTEIYLFCHVKIINRRRNCTLELVIVQEKMSASVKKKQERQGAKLNELLQEDEMKYAKKAVNSP